MLKASSLAQLRKADRQGRDGYAKGGTLAEQSKLCATSGVIACYTDAYRRYWDVYFVLKPVFERV